MLKSQKLREIAPELDPLRLGTGWKLEDQRNRHLKKSAYFYKDLIQTRTFERDDEEEYK